MTVVPAVLSATGMVLKTPDDSITSIPVSNWYGAEDIKQYQQSVSNWYGAEDPR